MFGRNEILIAIRDTLKITQENQRDIIDLREQSLKMQKEMMEFQSKLERNAERAAHEDAKVARDIRDHTAEHYVTVDRYTQAKKDIQEDMLGLENRLINEIKHKIDLFIVGWTVASVLIACGVYMLEHINPEVWH